MENVVLREVRLRAGLTQTELGAVVGLTAGSVCHVERGRWSFKPTAWLLLAAHPAIAESMAELGVTLAELMTGQRKDAA